MCKTFQMIWTICSGDKIHVVHIGLKMLLFFDCLCIQYEKLKKCIYCHCKIFMYDIFLNTFDYEKLLACV